MENPGVGKIFLSSWYPVRNKHLHHVSGNNAYPAVPAEPAESAVQ